MQKTLIFLPILLLLGIGCVRPEALTPQSDFTPIQGSATGSADPLRDFPYDRRILMADSQDGVTFSQTGAWVCDQCQSPDAVVKDGTLYLYYTGWIVGERLNTTAVARSFDDGRTWVYNYVDLVGGDPIDRIVDSEVVLLEDGTFRMFFTAGNPQGVHVAQSRDGIAFEYTGVVFSQRDDIAISPTVLNIDDTWHLYALSKEGAGRLWHLTSADGRTFSVYALTSFPINETAWTPSGVWRDDERSYLLLSHPEHTTIESMWSKNGFDWYPSEAPHLSASLDEPYVRDAEVVELDDGRRLMFYVTTIPTTERG